MNSSNLTDSKFVECDFTSAHLRGSLLSGVELNTSSFKGVDFSIATMASLDLRGVMLDEVNFKQTDLRGSDMTGASVVDVIWSNAKLEGAISSDGIAY